MSLPLNKVLPAIDKKDRKFWDRLTDEEKKAVLENTKHYQDNWKKYSKSIF